MIVSGDKVLVALSGGADSVTLLSVLSELKPKIGFEIFASHINHGIRGEEAKLDQDFCRELCKQHSIIFHTINLDIPAIAKKLKTSEENAGRIKRYEFFHKLCSDYGYTKIAVAHNMNDSVETALINMIRGCTLNGLGGIKPVNDIVIRPLYNVMRSEIENYIKSNNLSYCTDKTNYQNIYTRNCIRNVIIKDMEQINPSVVKTIFSNLQTISDDNDFIASYVLGLNAVKVEKNHVIIEKNIFDNQHIAIKKRIIYDAFYKILGSGKDIESKHINILLENLFSGNSYDMPHGIVVSVAFDKIYFAKKCVDNPKFCISISPGETVSLYGREFKAEFVNTYSKNDSDSIYIDYEKIKCDKLTLRSRKDGDKIHLFGLTGHKKIKQLMIELKIPSLQRDYIPLLCDGDEVVALVPYRICEKYKISDNTDKILRIQMIKEK